MLHVWFLISRMEKWPFQAGIRTQNKNSRSHKFSGALSNEKIHPKSPTNVFSQHNFPFKFQLLQQQNAKKISIKILEILVGVKKMLIKSNCSFSHHRQMWKDGSILFQVGDRNWNGSKKQLRRKFQWTCFEDFIFFYSCSLSPFKLTNIFHIT